MICLTRPRCTLCLIAAIWLGLFLVALYSRPALPVDETRYLSVAWEMWLRGDFLVPHINGEPYHHKPPLLFWLIHLSWWLFGVSEWAARLVTALAGLAGAWLALPLARRLWPGEQFTATLAVWILFTTLLWTMWTTALMFDLLVAVCAELAWLGILMGWRGRPRAGWALAGLGIALGVLAKGPVILAYVLPAALFAPLWIRNQRPGSWWRWYGGAGLALLIGAGLSLAWALPAAFAGGDEYRDAILWGQTANRMVESFAHGRPFWWYLPLLPLLLFPWSFWPPWWGALRRRWREGIDSGDRFALVAAGSGLLVFSLISGKQVHYLLPLVPLVALVSARALSGPAKTAPARYRDAVPVIVLPLLAGLVMAIAPSTPLVENGPPWVREISPLWGLLLGAAALAAWLIAPRMDPRLWPGVAVLFCVAVLYSGFLRELAVHYDINPFAVRVAAAQQAGRPVAFVGKYNGELNFAGRLTRPVVQVQKEELARWAFDHPGGVFADRAELPPPAEEPGVLHWEPYRSSFLLLREAASRAPAGASD